MSLHIRERLEAKKTYLYLAATLLILCVVLGALLPNFLPEALTGKMQSYITALLNQLINPQIVAAQPEGTFTSALGGYWLLLFFLWCSGLCPLGGLPAAALLAYRGVLLGLTINLLLHCDFAYGMVTVLLTLVPAHLVMIPVFLLATVLAAGFAKQFFQRAFHFDSGFLHYTAAFLVLGLLAVMGSWLQTVAAPFLLRFFVSLV